MNLFLEIMIGIWVTSTFGIGFGYISYLIQSTTNKTSIIRVINKSNTLNLFGKIFSNMLYLFLCPAIATLEWLIIAMTYHKRG